MTVMQLQHSFLLFSWNPDLRGANVGKKKKKVWFPNSKAEITLMKTQYTEMLALTRQDHSPSFGSGHILQYPHRRSVSIAVLLVVGTIGNKVDWGIFVLWKVGEKLPLQESLK